MTTTTLSGEDVTGQLLLPGDPGYDDARRVWNAMVDRRPRMIVRCASVDDVRAALRAAREHDLEVGVRCGGHSVLGLSVPDGGVMIDLTPLAAVRVDPERRRAWVQGGALLGALDVAAQEHELATTAGNVSHTGVGGLTLGGGMGWLARQHGLTCDNVVSFEMVTADGEVVRAAEDENPELYWGLRGGGGNFGIVTEFEFRLHPVGTRTLSVELDFPVDRAAGVLARWRDLDATAPRQATFAATVLDGTVTVGFVWLGDPEAGRRHARELQRLGRPASERIAELSYVELQRREDSVEGHALRRYWKGHYFRELPGAALDALLDHHPAVAASLQAYGGAIAEVPDDATAFSHRDAAFEYVAAARWTDPTEDADRMAQARRSAARLAPFASGAYVNALTDEGAAGVTRAYPPAKLARLTALKDAWDPGNVFHLNHHHLNRHRGSRTPNAVKEVRVVAGRYPEIEPYEHGMLGVGDGHLVYWEACGNPRGKPAVVLHGGPGSGCGPGVRRYFDPDAYRIVLFDQRGCGRSTPHASDPGSDLASNTTAHLLADLELLRRHLGVDRWLVLGGSWGSVLGLAYPEQHPDRVSEMVLSGVATGRRAETDLLTRGLGRLFLEAWGRFRDGVPAGDRDGDLADAYARLLGDPDPAVRAKAARNWCDWETAIIPTSPPHPRFADPAFRMAFARLVTHYWRHGSWLEEGVLLEQASRLAAIPGVLVQGMLDLGNLLGTPWELAGAWPGSELVLVDDAGHDAASPTITDHLVAATDRCKP